MSSYMELSHWTKRTGDSDYYKVSFQNWRID